VNNQESFIKEVLVIMRKGCPSGLNTYTKGKGSWKLIFVQEFETKSEALVKEKKLKRCNKEYLIWLITQPVNILNNK
jgi:predicted GIY-YIG superfamily endonuclease